MTTAAAPLQNVAAKSQPLSNSTHAGLVLQRKCACGSPTSSLTGDCAECTSKKRLQTKLTIGASNDSLEQEADRVADQVFAAPTNPAVSGAPPHIQRYTGQATGQEDTAPAGVERVLASPGRPLDPALRQDMEQRFGHDFSKVRVHADQAAGGSAERIDASAYTAGRDIVFGAGELRPATADGRRMIAHELTHVVQQGGAGAHSNSGHTIIQRRPARKGNRTKKRTIITIHAQPQKPGDATAYVAGETGALTITLTKNDMTEGSYTYVRRDNPSTPQVEYGRESGSGGGFHIQRPDDKSIEFAERLRFEIQPGEFDFDAYAKAEFEAVPDRFKKPLAKRGAPALRTADEYLGFANFAKELERRGVTDEELILFQERSQGGVDPRHRFDWAHDYEGAVDAVLGARGKLQKAEEANTQMFQGLGGTFIGTPKQVFKLYEASLSNPMLTPIAEEALAEVGLDRDAFEGHRGLLLAEFDIRLWLETNVALDKFEGGLLLARELLRGTDAQQRIAAAREAANSSEVRRLKSQKEEAQRNRDEAEVENTFAHLNPFSSIEILKTEEVKKVERSFEEKQTAYKESQAAHRAALESVSGIRVTALHGLDEDRFFYGGSAAEGFKFLEEYLAQKLWEVRRAREVLEEDKGTIYKADIMVDFTKERLGVSPGSEVDSLVNQWVEESTDAPWWSKLLDVLSFALIFVPGGAAVVVARLGVSGLQLATTIDQEVLSEMLARVGTKQEGGSAGTIILAGLGAAFDVADVAKIGTKAAGAVLGGATEQAPKVAARGKLLDVSEHAPVTPHAGLPEPVPSRGGPPEPPVSSGHRPGGDPDVPTEMRGTQMADEPRSIQIRAAEVPAAATAAELTALRNTEKAVLGRRGDLARDIERLRIEREGLDGAGGLRGQLAKRDELLNAGTLSQAGRDNVQREIKALVKQLDAKDAEIVKLEAKLSSLDEELAHARTRLRSEGAALPGQPPQLAAGRLREAEVGEAFSLGPKNNQPMRDPTPGGADFIPDFIDGQPTSLVWGRQYHFREVKDWADMADTGNLSAMLDYVSNPNFARSRLTIYYRSNTYMSGPLRTRIEALIQSGQVDLVPFAGL